MIFVSNFLEAFYDRNLKLKLNLTLYFLVFYFGIGIQSNQFSRIYEDIAQQLILFNILMRLISMFILFFIYIYMLLFLFLLCIYSSSLIYS
jgi:hypothetical protein